ncbi:MAG: DNA-3-methyladenine glycosylase I [Clostridiales bacterium]|jgi:DNA-3-methyladenine glycosylase I|nr:DNA-3-methyladenine glycosylase I [Clostridiales bacterium]
MKKSRCPWNFFDKIYVNYHDKEWGNPIRNDQKLFELLILEGAQAGLSWYTVLKRRKNYIKAFDNMNPELIACYTERDICRLLNDTRIIRNKLKIISVIKNARAYLRIMESSNSFSKWLWNWVDDEPIINFFKTTQEVPVSTPLSEIISRELKKLGFSFVGPKIIYAFLQAGGFVNDHLISCFKHPSFNKKNIYL